LRRARPAALAVAAIALALLAAGFTGTATARTYVPSFAAVKTDRGPVFRDGCLIYTNDVTSPPCRYGEVGSERKVIVFGDSHALQWTPALIKIAERRGWELTMLLRKNCTAAIVDSDPVCNRWRQNALRRIEAERPALVFVASNTASNTFVRRNGKRLSRAASEPVFRRGMYRALLRLRRAGAQVTVMRDLPMSRDFVPPVCVSENVNHPGRCSFPARRPLAEAYDFAAARRLRAVQIIDPLPRVCPGRKCRAVQRNVLKYRDRGHMSATYAVLLTNWLDVRLQDPFVRASAAAATEPARSVLNLNYNQDEIGPAQVSSNSLDLYLPAESGPESKGLKPVVVYVHGGGLMTGDKANRMPDKVRLFNGLGCVFASLNYRLSPDISDGNLDDAFAPDRVRAPDHIADVAEAIGWLSDHVSAYGGDPDRLILIGHSSGGQMVNLAGTAPAWIKGRGVSPKQVLGVISLDSDTFDVRSEADPATSTASLSRRISFWQVFGTPDEEAANPFWDSQSPLLSADPSDPPFLFVTQSARPARVASNGEMATRLGQNPQDSVVGVPYDHNGINTALGAADDSSAETTRVSQFTRELIDAALPAGVKITRRPAKKIAVRVKAKGRRPAARKRALRRARAKVRFAFKWTGRASGFQCRIDRKSFQKCHSPRTYRLGLGKHTFRVRPLYPSGRPGETRKVDFRIVARWSRA
jgi:acetyl esterase/lipase